MAANSLSCILISSIAISFINLDNVGMFANEIRETVAQTKATFRTTEKTSVATTASHLIITVTNTTQPTASSTRMTTPPPSPLPKSTTITTSLPPAIAGSSSPTTTTTTTTTTPTTSSTLATTQATTRTTIPTTTITTPTTRLTTTPTTTTTTEAPLTCSTNTSTCPRGWFRAERDVCVMVETVPKLLNTTLDALNACSNYGTRAFQLNATTRTVHTMSCIKGFLASSRIPGILLGDARVFLINTNQEVDVGRYMHYYYSYRRFIHFVCLMRRSDVDLPKIVKFSLTVTNVPEGIISTQDLLQTNGTLLVPIRRHNQVSFTCQSSSDPPPQVWQERDNQSVPQPSYTSSSTIQWHNVSCTDSSTFSCTARNYYGWMKMWIRIQFRHARSVEFLDFGVFQGNLPVKGAIPLNADVSLWCSINACPRPSVLTIEDSQRLPIFSVPNSLSVQYQVRLVHCQDMGPYFCAARTQDGGVVEVRTELVVNGRCPVQPCRGEPLSRVLPAALGETVNISLCILTYPNPSAFYDPRLSVNLTKTPGSQLMYTAHLILSNIQHSDYKTHSLVFNNVHGAVVFNISLGPPGPPPCPTVVTVTDTGLDYVSLSWQPGEDEGMLQTFHVFYSVNNRTWRRWEVAEEEGSEVTVSGLKHDTGYFFRVVASNEFFPLVNQNICKETVLARTASHKTTSRVVPASASSDVDESLPGHGTHPPSDRLRTSHPADIHQSSPTRPKGRSASPSTSLPKHQATDNTSDTAPDVKPGPTPRTLTTASSVGPGSPPTILPEHLLAEHTRPPGLNPHQEEQSQAVSLNYLHISLPIVSLNVAVLLMCALLLYINRGRLFSKQKDTSAWKKYDELSTDYFKYSRGSIQESETNSTVHLMSDADTQAVSEM